MNQTLPGPETAVRFAILLALSFYLGLAMEGVKTHEGRPHPGGVRTFPILATTGGLLYLLDRAYLAPFVAGLLAVGAWLAVFYHEHIRLPDETGQPNVGLVQVSLNLLAYVLGAVALALPPWVAVGATVAAVLFFTGRARLHALAQGLDLREVVTAAEFLILTGLILPLLPDKPVSDLTSITPRSAWLALLVVSALSYGSYLLRRYARLPGGVLWTAALGGLYSSTATTVVLARGLKTAPSGSRDMTSGIVLATALMHLRILAVVAVFNLALARSLAPAMVGLAAAGLAVTAAMYHSGRKGEPAVQTPAAAGNPLELGAAGLFAVLFVAMSLLTAVVTRRFGVSGLYGLAALVGLSDIDPFVLNVAQGGARNLPPGALGGAIVLAASSNNLVKAAYAMAFGGRKAAPAALALGALAAAGAGLAGWLAIG